MCAPCAQIAHRNGSHPSLTAAAGNRSELSEDVTGGVCRAGRRDDSVVRTFLSYSRQDASFVTDMAQTLERRGIDVWMDTDDIRGSEPWRRSIVDAITSADAVVLIVSPASMTSKNVEREITVAAEVHRRIVPVVIEAATLPAALQYELAGVQQVIATGRPLDEVVDDLEEALRGVGAPPAPSPSGDVAPVAATLGRTTGTAGRRRASRSVVAAAAVVVIGVVGIVVLRRGGGDGSDGDTAAADDSAVSATDPALADEVTEVALDATVWFAGFEISASAARYDPANDQVVVDAEIVNTQRIAAEPGGLFLGSTSVLEVGGQRLTVWCDGCTRLPPGARVSTALTADFVEDIRLDEAALVFGGPQQHQATIPLGGGPATGAPPQTVPAGGLIDDQQAVTFEVQQVEIVPAACSGYGKDLGFVPGRSDEVSIVVVGTALSYAEYPVNLGEATLVLPDGSGPYASSTLNGNMIGLQPGVPVGDVPACFVVPAPASGEYRFALRAMGTTTEPTAVPFTL